MKEIKTINWDDYPNLRKLTYENTLLNVEENFPSQETTKRVLNPVRTMTLEQGDLYAKELLEILEETRDDKNVLLKAEQTIRNIMD